jgi:hypothetical protein
MAIPYLRSLRNSIEKLSKWESSGEAFGFIDGVSNKNPDYIYEFYCAMRILNDLKTNHSIEIRQGNKGYTFPQKPGNKADSAKFLIKNKRTKIVVAQFCLGTNIKLTPSPNTTFGADISLQRRNADDDPYDTDVILIMDAKYKKSKTSKLDIGTIREFAQCVRDMNAPKRNPLKFDKLTQVNFNCLFTNGEALAQHMQYCKNNKLKQVGKFDCDRRTIDVIG